MRGWAIGICAVSLLLALCACQGAESPGLPVTESTEVSSHTTEQLPMEDVLYYQNPVMSAKTADAWRGYGFGDPFVMRHNGTYYLYVSTKDGEVGVQCWTSQDLVNWTYAGLCATDQRTRSAYAPEVYYYNGYFYMYTSPAGQGHYVLRSTSPTEGFEVITDNMGMSIDGSVFIDSDGSWYFYSANHGEMMVYDMTSPFAMRNGRTLSSVSVGGGWTEGPMTVYHDGYYYITYTGNHVLSRAYRINYGVSATSPVAFADASAKNPLLIHTAGDLFGIGHSSTVKGPDLDSYYIVYHSLVNATPNRSMNVDRIVFNGTSMQILGPIDGKQQVPQMPDVYHHFDPGTSLAGWQLTGDFGSAGKGLPLADGARIVSEQVLVGDFTAEYHVTHIAQGAQAGALFAFTDQDNYGACYFDPATQSLRIELVRNGEVSAERVPLPKSFGEDVRFDCVQSLQIERSGNQYSFYFGDRLLHVLTSDALGDGGIGYAVRGGDASFGFIGGTAAVGGRGAADTYHSIGEQSGLVPASHAFDGVKDTAKIDGVHAVVALAGSELRYLVYAQEGGDFDMTVRFAAEQSAKAEILVDGKAVATVQFASGKGLLSEICRRIPIEEGQHVLSVRMTSGEASFVDFTLKTHKEVEAQLLTFDGQEADARYTDGAWEMSDGVIATRRVECAKRLWGSENWGDYAVSVLVTPKRGVNCGLLLRATNPGAPNFAHVAPTAQDAAGGTDWLQGYFVGLTREGVVLGKQHYGYTELASAKGRFAEGEKYLLRAECVGNTIRVYVDGVLYLTFTDPDPYMQGMVGVRVHQCSAAFDELCIEPMMSQ